MTYARLTAAGVIIGAVIFWLFLRSPSEPAVQQALPAMPEQIQELSIDKPEVRTVDDNQAENALRLLGLWETDEDTHWDRRTGEAGQYEFSNLSLEGGDIRISKLTIGGVRLINPDIPYFDVIEGEAVSVSNPQKDWRGDAANLILTLPDKEGTEDFLAGQISKPEDTRLYNLIALFLAEDSGPPALPEFKAETVRYFETGETRQYNPVPQNSTDSDEIVVPAFDYETVETFETITVETVSLSAQPDTDLYNFQIKNYRFESGTVGALDTDKSAISGLTLLGLGVESKDILRQGDLFADELMMSEDDPYNPIYQLLSVTGFNGADGPNQFEIPQFSMSYSAKAGGQFFKNVQAPIIKVSTAPPPEPAADVDAPAYSYHNPFSPEKFIENGTFSYSSESFFDETTQTMELRHLTFIKENSFKVSMSHKISGWNGFNSMFQGTFDHYVEEEDPLAVPDPIEEPKGVQIHHGQISFSDRGIRDEIFDLMFSEKGLDIEASKNIMKAPFLLMPTAARSDYQERLSSDIAASFESFIDVGGRLEMTVAPSQPVVFMDFMDSFESYILASSYGLAADDTSNDQRIREMDEAMRKVNLSITHNFAD
ncbi:MAG: hypothetical protein HKN36_04640 [Hellea sp.]|nr:hypothetical protein [Hellea sp.]